MIQSLSAENFRCYESLELHGLKRINVVVGKNASGKSSLLEAIFLAAGGSPEIAIRFRLWRGMGQGAQIHMDRRSFEGLWKDLFFSFDQKRRISLRIVGSKENTASLNISYSDQTVLAIPVDAPTGGLQAAVYPLDFEWKDEAGKMARGRIKIGGPTGLELESIIDTVPCALFAPGWGTGNPQEHAQRFSNLSKQHSENFVKSAIREEFDFIKDLSVELSGGNAMVYASVDYLPEKVPIGVISNGVMKFLYLLLAIEAYPHGVVLIDEIEGGFYYDRMPSIWAALLRFAQRTGCQLFAATHSLECLNSLSLAAERNPDEFSLIRTSKVENRVSVRVFSGQTLGAIIRQGFDPRE